MPSSWQVRKDHDVAQLTISGEIDETSDFAAILGEIAAPKVIVDLARVKRINSAGVREWLTFIAEIHRRGLDVTLENCAPPVVAQLNMISKFAVSARIVSVLAPYVCDSCDHEHLERVDLITDAPRVEPTATCPSCGKTSSFDDLVDEYLRFRQRYRSMPAPAPAAGDDSNT